MGNTIIISFWYIPFWLAIEQCAGGVDVDHLLVYEGPVTFLRVLFGCIPEETTAYGLLYTHCGLTTRYHIQLVPEDNMQYCIIINNVYNYGV